MPRYSVILAFLAAFGHFACQNPVDSSKPPAKNAAGKPVFTAVHGTAALDGSGSDTVWEKTNWLPLDQPWYGKAAPKTDVSGRYKLAWDENFLYILAEIEDDKAWEAHNQGNEGYWNDDCLLVLIDEDVSGGDHEFNHNAFAYHIALDDQVVDIAPDSSFRLFNDHCFVRRIPKGNSSTWEIGVRIFDGNHFNPEGENVPKLLKQGKKIGFALAYKDNDGSLECENIIGNLEMPTTNDKRSWTDASTFGILTLE